MKIAEAMRLIRTREGLTQTAASKLDGAPDFRTLSHWETRRKMPSVKLLDGYLRSMGLDFIDLQVALDLVEGKAPRPMRDGQEEIRQRVDDLEGLEQRVDDLDHRLQQIDAIQAAADPLICVVVAAFGQPSRLDDNGNKDMAGRVSQD